MIYKFSSAKEDIGVGVSGKYFKEYQESHNVVLLKPEVAKVFPTDKAVNDALILLIKVSKASINLTKDYPGRV